MVLALALFADCMDGVWENSLTGTSGRSAVVVICRQSADLTCKESVEEIELFAGVVDFWSVSGIFGQSAVSAVAMLGLEYWHWPVVRLQQSVI